MDKTMRVGILVNNFSLLNKITRRIKNSEFNLKHLKNIPNYDHEVDIIVSDKPLENCIIPHTITDDLDILELKIRSVYYNKKNLTIGIDPGGICGVAVLSKNHVLFCKEFDNINQMSKTIQSIDREIGIEQIKIGIGSPSHRNMIEQAINMFEGKILFVDEQRSGSGSHGARALHQAAYSAVYLYPLGREPAALCDPHERPALSGGRTGAGPALYRLGHCPAAQQPPARGHQDLQVFAVVPAVAVCGRVFIAFIEPELAKDTSKLVWRARFAKF